MTIEIKIAIYLVLFLTQILFGFFKKKIFGVIPIFVSLIIFMITKIEQFYEAGIIQVFIFVIMYSATLIINKIINKKRLSEVDKMKIKDL